MLVLSRKVNESIVLNDNIVVTILEVENGRVSLGVEAPREVKIFRSELVDSGREEEGIDRETGVDDLIEGRQAIENA